MNRRTVEELRAAKARGIGNGMWDQREKERKAGPCCILDLRRRTEVMREMLERGAASNSIASLIPSLIPFGLRDEDEVDRERETHP